MKYFIKNIVLFFIPIFLFLLVPFLILYSTKEYFFDLEKINTKEKKYLIGYYYNENNYNRIKYNNIIQNERRDIIVLGSSRVLEFRSNMFNGSFYNAGFTIKGLADFEAFLKLIPQNKLPKYLIIGLDQWMFNKSYDSLEINDFHEVKSELDNSLINYKEGLNQFKLVYKDIYKIWIDQFRLANANDITPIGLNAKFNNTGFRNDGSMQYGLQIEKLLIGDPSAEDYNYNDTFERIKNGNNRFEYSNSMNMETIPILVSLLKFCNNNRIKVIGFLPPFADAVFKIMEKSNNYLYINELLPNIEPVFKKHSAEIYQFNSMKEFYSSDLETLDGFHGSEKAYLRILIEMINRGSILNKVCQVDQLKRDVIKSTNNYVVYPY